MKHSSFNGPEDVEMAMRRAFDRIPKSELMNELEKLKTHFDIFQLLNENRIGAI